MPSHEDTVRESFRRQVDLFTGEDSPFASPVPQLEWLGPVSREFLALEVACGAAHVAQDLAPHVRAVTGLDLTRELLELGSERIRAAGLTNVLLQEGNAERMPFVDGSFDVVYCRASLHHFADPERAVAEMVRVCRPGGRVALSDMMVPDPAVRDTFDAVHRLLDPSHMRAYSENELVAVFPAGMEVSALARMSGRIPLDVIITEQSDRAGVYDMLQAEIEGGPVTGFAPAWEDDKLVVQFAVGTFDGVKP
jgi:SAM-dependent methyltransferase